jgi:hypothetical protein
MTLNLPFLWKKRNILIAGAGGGSDILGALPLAYELWQDNRVVLASYSYALDHSKAREAAAADYPEGPVAAASGCTVYIFGKTGVKPLLESYRQLVNQQQIDTVLLVDGGVDSLMRGDEESPGTLLEDFVSLCAVDQLDVPVKILGCLGFGTETDEGLCHYRALENMAALIHDGFFLGSCALTQEMEAFRYYEGIARQVFACQTNPPSHIHTRVIPAVHGEFGNRLMYSGIHAPVDLLAEKPPFVSPLMTLYWFFQVSGVVRHNRFARDLVETETFDDVREVHRKLRYALRNDLRSDKPITL